jgi:flavin-dependent dehydrogenase/pimeloyl-ACP methyl ester carboxylesterase
MLAAEAGFGGEGKGVGVARADEYDVVVVGASIAGCTAATLLGRTGARVAVLEQRSDPTAYKTICTHFIQASATPTLESVGLAERIEAAGGVRNGFQLWSRYGWVQPEIGEDYPFPRYGYDIRREKLDPMVRDLAAETPGVELLFGQTVTGVIQPNGRPTGVRAVDRERGEHEIGARVIVAADGRDTDIARLAGVRARVMPHNRFGYFAYYRDLPLDSGERSMMWLLDPDVAYAFVQDGGLTLLATFQTKDRMSWFKRDYAANFEAVFRGLPSAPDISKAERTSKILGKLDMPNKVRPAARPGLAFVGDAAMAADPLWGVGCGWAFQSGGWLGEELGEALAGSPSDKDLDAALERYRKRHRGELMAHFFMTSDYATGRRFNPMERMIFSAGAKDQECAQSFYAFGSRSIKPTDPEFRGLMRRAARVCATPRRTKPVRLAGAYAEGTPPPVNVESSRIEIDGIAAPLSSVGDQSSAEAVVFVHGNPGSRRDWDDLLSRVEPFGRGVAFDMPGFGRADRPRGFDYTVEGYARFLGAALDQLEIERAHLVLHDFGGPWGLAWAVFNPDRLASAVLINTGALVGYRPFVDRIYDDMDRGTSRAILSLYRATDNPGEGGRIIADALRPLDRPALVVWGAHDPYIPVKMANLQREAFPGAQIEILEDSGHWPFADDPEGVGRVVEPFLRRVAGAQRVVVGV